MLQSLSDFSDDVHVIISNKLLSAVEELDSFISNGRPPEYNIMCVYFYVHINLYIYVCLHVCVSIFYTYINTYVYKYKHIAYRYMLHVLVVYKPQ